MLLQMRLKLGILLRNEDVKSSMHWMIKAAHAGETQAQSLLTYVSNQTQATDINVAFRRMDEALQREIVAAIISWIMTKQTLTPLMTVTEFAKEITETKDLSRRIPISDQQKDDEVGQLIFAFNETNVVQKRLYYGIAFVSLIGLFINYGRAAQIGFVLTAIVLLVTYFRKNLNLKMLFLFLLVLGAGVFVLNSVGKLDRFKTGFQELTKYQDIQSLEGSWGCRLYLIHASKEIILNDPIFGTGAGDNIDKLIEWTKKHPNPQTDWNRTFHNQHLEFITKYGLLGYFLLISAVVILLYQLKDLPLAFGSALTFFTFTAFDGIADIIILMKPYNNIFAMMFVLFAVIAYEKQIGMTPKNERLC